ncbi:hypothetical protein MD484_g93, partial [Candolleomyces efflorescens]
MLSSDHLKLVFHTFRDQIDADNDRRERLIKASRDITSLSKKTIFLLHRSVLEAESLDEEQVYVKAARKGYEKLKEVQSIYATLGPELQGDQFWKHERQVSPGLQEYIEALSFAYYLEHGSLIPFADVQRSVSDSSGNPYFPLTVSDYLLGLSDLTGELMRFAISGLSRKGGRKKALGVCAFVRSCKSDFELFTPHIYELRKKQAVTANSLEKIEDTVYAIVVRSSEYDLPPEMLDDIVAQATSHGADRSRRPQSEANRADDDF